MREGECVKGEREVKERKRKQGREREREGEGEGVGETLFLLKHADRHI